VRGRRSDAVHERPAARKALARERSVTIRHGRRHDDERDEMRRLDHGRRLLWHGLLLFLLGLLTGLVVPALTNPRMGLSAHLEGVMNGTFLAVLGLAWERLVLSERAAVALFRLALYGTYANWASTLLAAVFATNRSTPIAGAGYGGRPWQENVVDFGLISLAIAIMAACVLALWGLRRRPVAPPPEGPDAVSRSRERRAGRN
jgi:hydroxylaminobenzene mutase